MAKIIHRLVSRYHLAQAFHVEAVAAVAALCTFCSAADGKRDWYADSWVQTHMSITVPEPRQVADPTQTSPDLLFFQHQVERVRPDAIKFHTRDLWLMETVTTLGLPEKLGFHPVATINRAGSWYSMYDEDDRFVYRVHPDGKVAGRWGRKHLCFNSPGVDEVLIPDYFIDVTRRVNPHQVWIDEALITVNLCYCEHCLKLYQQEHNADPPDALTSENFADWQRWVGFHRESFRRWMAKVVDAVHSVAPGILVTFNASYFMSMPEEPPSFIRNLHMDVHKDPLELGMFARYGGSHHLPFDLLPGLGQDIWAGIEPKPLERVLHDIGLITAHGGIWQMGEFPTNFTSLRIEPGYQGNGYRPALEYLELAHKGAEFARERKPYSQHSRSAADVALLHSAETHYSHVIFNMAGEESEVSYGLTSDGHREPNQEGLNSRIYWPNNNSAASDVVGAYLALLERQIHFDIVYEQKLQRDRGRYRLVVLPEQAFLTEETREAIRDIVRDGGKIVASGATALAGLDDVLGIAPVTSSPMTGMNIEVINGRVPTHRFWKVRLNTAMAVAVEPESGLPGVTVNRFGKGTAVYVAGDVFKNVYASSGYAYERSEDAAGPRKLIEALLEAAAWRPAVRVQSPPWVEFVHRVKGGNDYFHFLNRKVDWNGGAEAVVANTVSVLAPVDARPLKLLLQPGNEPLGFVWEDGRVFFSVDLDRVENHRIVEMVFEL